MTLQITSTAFSEGSMIPVQNTCDGPDVSPDLAWTGVPEGARSLAPICDDPDAPVGTWVHWVVYDIDPDKTIIIEGQAPGTEGINDFGKIIEFPRCRRAFLPTMIAHQF